MGHSWVAHDHVVLLLGREEFDDPPAWLTDNFFIVEGGTHAGGSSRNKLIVFRDGTYLELFTWINEPKEFLAWSKRPAGLIDFALTTLPPGTAEDNHDRLHQQLKDSDLGISYSKPQAGGRKRMDGAEVKWKTTRPVFSPFKRPPKDVYLHDERLDVPFFCHDVTERNVRVPFNDNNVTTHPCGATGISNIQLVVPESHMSSYTSLCRSLFGITEEVRLNEIGREHFMFEVRLPNPIEMGDLSAISLHSPAHTGSDVLSREENTSTDDQRYEQWLTERGIGICGLVLHVESKGAAVQELRRLDDTGIGASIYLSPHLCETYVDGKRTQASH